MRGVVGLIAAMSVIIAGVLLFQFVQQQNDRAKAQAALKVGGCVMEGHTQYQCTHLPPGQDYVEPEVPPGFTPPAKPTP